MNMMLREPVLQDAVASSFRSAQLGGRPRNLQWSLYPQGNRLQLTLRDASGTSIPATADVNWICNEDEILLRNADIQAALARAGVVQERYTRLNTVNGELVLARLTDNCLHQLPALLDS